MNLKIYQIDAFAKTVFEGNPAAVVPLDAWLDDMLMQKIAMENNLSETVYFVKEGAHYRIRWFTPVAEVDMCGHATLSSAFVLFEELGFSGDEVVFESKSGLLRVQKDGARYVMDFPAQELMACDVPQSLQEAFAHKILVCYKAMDYLVVFENEEDILHAMPNMQKLRELDARGVIITAKSAKYDFVCRFFAPKLGIDEDPATGAAFTQLVPYWSEVLGKKSFHTKQVSARGGEVWCASFGERVQIAGYGVKYFEGVIQL